MFKRISTRAFFAVVLVIVLMLCASCGSKQETPVSKQTQQKTDASENASSGTAENITQKSDAEQTVSDEPETDENTKSEQNQEPVSPASEEISDVIKKIGGESDDAGICSTVITLSNKAADKGVVEMVYDGAAGTPQEGSVVCTFRIEYFKDSAGTFEISTFYNGEVYQNQHQKESVKVVNTFGAGVRAGSVVISYTPDGGETQEIFRADADYFR